MYKHIALLILSGVLVTGCDKKADAPADVTSAPETTTSVAAEPAPAPEPTPAPTEEAPATTGGEIGIAECDDYINKYKACMDKLPAEGRAAYQQGLDQMVSAWKQVPTEARSSLAEGCKMATENAKTAMQAMGCEW